MDFVAREIFFLFLFSLTLGTFGNVVGTAQQNQAVVVGAPVKITCSSDAVAGNLIKWSFIPVGGNMDGDGTTIKAVNGNIKDTDNYSGLAVDKSYTLTINQATQSTAGLYICTDSNRLSTLLIVLEQTCDYSPRPSNTHPCGSTLTLSCTLNCFVDPKYLKNTPDLTWLNESDDVLVREDSSPPTMTTKKSTLNVTLQENVKAMQIYKCQTTMTMFSTKLPGHTSVVNVTSTNTCQPFASATDVPCGETEDPSTTTGADDIHQSKLSSPRSAETNNLAIRVLGVAGVLLLAQMF